MRGCIVIDADDVRAGAGLAVAVVLLLMLVAVLNVGVNTKRIADALDRAHPKAGAK